MSRSPYYIMGMGVSAFVCIATMAACEDTPNQPAPTVGPMERLRTSENYSDVLVVKDEKRNVVCYITGGTGGGISCVHVNPSTDDAGAKP